MAEKLLVAKLPAAPAVRCSALVLPGLVVQVTRRWLPSGGKGVMRNDEARVGAVWAACQGAPNVSPQYRRAFQGEVAGIGNRTGGVAGTDRAGVGGVGADDADAGQKGAIRDRQPIHEAVRAADEVERRGADA